MYNRSLRSCFAFCALAFLLSGCTYEEVHVPGNYPAAIEEIMQTKCAVSGCHNTQSKDAAAGLDLSTWSALMDGGRNGAAVIPYRPDFSLLIYYTNHDNLLPYLQLIPTMPYDDSPLSLDELTTLKNWIEQGAPDVNGKVKYQDEPERKKFYVTCQGCDEVVVFDADDHLAMRYVHVGATPSSEGPHMIRVAPNNEFWCVAFYASNYFSKYSVEDNSFLGSVDIGFGSWNTFVFTSDSKKAYAVDWSGSGRIAFIDVENMTAVVYTFGFTYPHGSALNATEDTLYVTGSIGNYIYKIPVNDPFNYQQVNFTGGQHNFHDVLFSPDGSKYFLTGQNTNVVLVVNTADDSIIATIPVGYYPQELALSLDRPYLFVTCMEDQNTFPGKRGSVSVINYNTYQHITSVYTGHQPHGLAVDDVNDRVIVANRNVSAGGPPPHHASACLGQNGYVTAIDMSMLQLFPGFKAEVSVDPYGVGIMK